MPWSFKILYGLISDNCPLYGSRRKNYLVLMSFIQLSATLLLAGYQGTQEKFTALMLFFMSLSVACNDVIVDSLMVIQSRRYPEDGSEQLQTFSWCCLACGGITGSVTAAFLTQYYHPNWCFLFAALPSLVLTIVAQRLPMSIEQIDGIQRESRGFVTEFNQSIGEIGEALKVPVFHRVLLFMLLNALLIPSFGSFGYYFMLDIVKISKFTIAMLGVLGFFCLLIGSSLYKVWFNKQEFRTLYLYSIIMSLCFAPMVMMFVLRKNVEWGIPDMAVIIFSEIVSDTLGQCMGLLPLMVMFAKITPKRIEATGFAFLTGTSNLTGTLKSLVGTVVNTLFVGVTQEDLSKYYILVCISIATSVIPLTYLRLLPLRSDIDAHHAKEAEA